jgi:hypothetical protein
LQPASQERLVDDGHLFSRVFSPALFSMRLAVFCVELVNGNNFLVPFAW